METASSSTSLTFHPSLQCCQDLDMGWALFSIWNGNSTEGSQKLLGSGEAILMESYHFLMFFLSQGCSSLPYQPTTHRWQRFDGWTKYCNGYCNWKGGYEIKDCQDCHIIWTGDDQEAACSIRQLFQQLEGDWDGWKGLSNTGLQNSILTRGS